MSGSSRCQRVRGAGGAGERTDHGRDRGTAALSGRLGAAAAVADGVSRVAGGSTLHPEVAAALSTFLSTWDDAAGASTLRGL